MIYLYIFGLLQWPEDKRNSLPARGKIYRPVFDKEKEKEITLHPHLHCWRNMSISQTKPKWGLCLGIAMSGPTAEKPLKTLSKRAQTETHRFFNLFWRGKHNIQIDIFIKRFVVHMKGKKSNIKITWKGPSPEKFVEWWILFKKSEYSNLLKILVH